jgi:HEAT repeat protein
MVPKNYDVLVKALGEDKDPETRAACAMLLGWAADKKAVIVPLEAALKDPNVQVRTKAARSLVPIAYHAAHTAVLFPLNPVLDLLHQPTSPDRTKALAILLQLAEDPVHQAVIREKAGELLVKIAGARQPVQREHAVVLLTLVTGEDYGRDVGKWQAWWKAQKAGTWSPTKKKEASKSLKPSGGNR